MIFRSMNRNDWDAVAEIYRQGIASGHATFETEVPNWEKWNSDHLSHSRIVVTLNGEIQGWAALSPVSGRCVYGGVAEVSVYVATDHYGKKLGSGLLSQLIDLSEQNGIWTLQSGIFPENKASLKIHLNLGFREVGIRKKIGKMNGIWRDTVLLERRSKLVGEA